MPLVTIDIVHTATEADACLFADLMNKELVNAFTFDLHSKVLYRFITDFVGQLVTGCFTQQPFFAGGCHFVYIT
jgi:hypothetical protein